MPDDAGGPARPDGADHGESKEELDAPVFDDAFVNAACVHEPTADERIAEAVEARMREEPPGTRLLNGPGFSGPEIEPAEHPVELYDTFGVPHGADSYPDADACSDAGADSELGFDSRRAASRQPARGHRMVAWVLAVIMGIGVLAMAVTAVYRSTVSAPASGPIEPGRVGPARQPTVVVNPAP
jgi:hypothetical protein